MRAFRRSVFAWIALLGILFTQFAVAAYACPSLPHTTSEQTQAASDSHGLPCPEMATQSHGAFEAQPPDLCNFRFRSLQSDTNESLPPFGLCLDCAARDPVHAVRSGGIRVPVVAAYDKRTDAGSV